MENNWTPDKPIDYDDAELTHSMTIMIQSNYESSYCFWTFPEPHLDMCDVAIWRVKSLKPKV